MLPKLNRQRALFVLTKIDEILAWEQRQQAERDTGLWNSEDTCARCGRGNTGA